MRSVPTSTSAPSRPSDLAGLLFDEYIHNRNEQLLTTVNVLVSDFGFKQAVAGGDHRHDSLGADQSRGPSRSATVAVLLDLDGRVVVSSSDDAAYARSAPGSRRCRRAPSLETVSHRVVYLGGMPYQTVTVPLRAPVTVAWVMLGFPIDDALAARLQSLTGLDVSFVHFTRRRAAVLASTLPRDDDRHRARGPRPDALRRATAPALTRRASYRCCGRS